MDNKVPDIEIFVSQITSSHEKVKSALEHGLNIEYTDDEILSFFGLLNESSLFVNSVISRKVADYLQLLKNESNYNKVSLEQIKKLYQNLIEIHPFDITFYESLAWYLYNVFDAKEEANKVINLGINKISSRLDELKNDFK
jgi:hypothetical protein